MVHLTDLVSRSLREALLDARRDTVTHGATSIFAGTICQLAHALIIPFLSLNDILYFCQENGKFFQKTNIFYLNQL